MNNDMDIQTAHSLICKIIEKGGLFGSIAKKYSGQAETEHQYLLECYEQVHTIGAKEFWGNELIKEIVNYKMNYGGGIDLQNERIKIYKSSQLLNDIKEKSKRSN